MAFERAVLVKLLAETRQFKREMAQAGKSTRGIGDGASSSAGKMKLLGKAAKVGALGIAAAGAAGIAEFAKFDDKLNQSISIMGDVSGTMRDDLADAAREIGTSTRFGADEAAESLFFLASAGLDAEQSIAAMPQVAAFAQAGMFDLATATDLATDAQSALGLSVDDPAKNLANLTRTTDVLVKANTLANASVQQFSESLTNKAGSALKVLGKDMEEGVAVLAAFADQGVKGTEAGEKLNIVLRDLQTSSIKNRDTWDELGLSVFDANGEMRNIADIVGGLEGALAGASDEQARLTLMSLGFQDRSVSAIMTLLGTSDAIREYEGELRNAGGTTEDVAEKQLQSFSAQMDLLKGRVKDVGIGIGEQLAPGLLKAADGLVEFVEAIGPAIGALGGLIGLVGDYLSFVGKGATSFSALFGDEDAKRALRFGEAIDFVTAAGESGSSVYDAYANAIQHLATNGALTADTLAELSDAADVNVESSAGAIKTNLEWARANGVAADQVMVLEEALRNSIDVMDITAEEADELKRKYGLLGPEAEGVRDSWMGANEATKDGADAMEGAQGPAVDLASEISALEEELLAARNAQESLSNVLKSAADPAFAAVSAFQSYQQVLKEIDEDGERSAEEQLRLAESILGTQVALDGLSGDNLEKALDSIAIALDTDREAVIALLNELGILDGTTVQALIDVGLTGSGSGAVAASGSALFSGGPRQHGGGVSPGQRFLVGESGPEMFIPTTPGSIVPGSVDQSRHMTNNFIDPRLAGNPVKAIRSAFAFDSLGSSF